MGSFFDSSDAQEENKAEPIKLLPNPTDKETLVLCDRNVLLDLFRDGFFISIGLI
jgi:hypothetical protein